MRRWLAVAAAGLLAVTVAAPVSAGPHVSNQSGSVVEGDGFWSSYDPETGDEVYGEAWVAQQKGQPGFVNLLYEQAGMFVGCEVAGGNGEVKGVTPEDTTPGGFVGTYLQGYGEVTISVDRQLTELTASGTIWLTIAAVDDCTGAYDISFDGEVAFEATYTGVGDLVSYRGFDSAKIPSVFNGHSTYRGTERMAAGMVDFEQGQRAFTDGWIDQFTWTDHCNGTGCGY